MAGSSLCAQLQLRISQCAPATAEDSKERDAIGDKDACLIRHETAGDLGRGLGGHDSFDACSSEAAPDPNHIKSGSKPPASSGEGDCFSLFKVRSTMALCCLLQL